MTHVPSSVRRCLVPLLLFLVLAGFAAPASAHGVAEGDAGYIQEITGVIFFLSRPVEPAAVAAPAPDDGEPSAPAAGRSDDVRFSLEPGQGAEYKLVMRRGARARFSWVAEGGPVNYDAHGSAPGQRISYGTGRGVPRDEGEREAAFDGDHGWFFRNRTDAIVTVTLRTSGDYLELKKVL